MTNTVKRCDWALGSELEQQYHDREWGVALHDDRKLFEFITLEGAQAGLSWATILKKRENYRKLFDDFDVVKIARYNKRKIETLLKNPGIIRNRLKVESTISNARAFIEIQNEFSSFDNYIWQFTDGAPVVNLAGCTRQYGNIRHDVERTKKTRLPLRWQHHLLCIHAGNRHG